MAPELSNSTSRSPPHRSALKTTTAAVKSLSRTPSQRSALKVNVAVSKAKAAGTRQKPKALTTVLSGMSAQSKLRGDSKDGRAGGRRNKATPGKAPPGKAPFGVGADMREYDMEALHRHLSKATQQLFNTRAIVGPLREELKEFRERSELVFREQHALEQELEKHRGEMQEMRERHRLAVCENSEYKEQLLEGRKEIERTKELVRNAIETEDAMEDAENEHMRKLVADRKRHEAFLGIHDTLEHELKDITHEQSLLKEHLVEIHEVCAKDELSIRKEQKIQMEAHIDLCEAQKRKKFLADKIPKWERVRTDLKDQISRAEHTHILKEREVGTILGQNRNLKTALARAQNGNKILEERVLKAEQTAQEIHDKMAEAARVVLQKRPTLAMLGGHGSQDPMAVAAYEYVKTGNDEAIPTTIIQPDKHGRPSLVFAAPIKVDTPVREDAHSKAEPHKKLEEPSALDGENAPSKADPPRKLEEPIEPAMEKEANLLERQKVLSPVVEETQAESDSSTSEKSSAASSSSGSSRNNAEPSNVSGSTHGLVGGSGVLDQDGFPVYWAGITDWDEDDESLMRQLLDSPLHGSLLEKGDQGRSVEAAARVQKKDRRRKPKVEKAGATDARRRKAKSRIKSKNCSKTAEDGSDGGSTRYASSSEVAGLSVYSLTDDAGSSWPEML